MTFIPKITSKLLNKSGAMWIMLIEIAEQMRIGKGQELQDVHDVLAKDNACYVLITCGVPAEDGKMQVEMTYEGDRSLAAFLIESAQGIITEQENRFS